MKNLMEILLSSLAFISLTSGCMHSRISAEVFKIRKMMPENCNVLYISETSGELRVVTQGKDSITDTSYFDTNNDGKYDARVGITYPRKMQTTIPIKEKAANYEGEI